jgi:hypothetical protein
MGASSFAGPGSTRAAGRRFPSPAGSRPSGDDPWCKRIQNPSPGAVGPASRLRRRYADAPTAALLTGLRVAVGPASRLRRRYADAPAAAFFCFIFVSASRSADFVSLRLGPAGPQAVKTKAPTKNGGGNGGPCSRPKKEGAPARATPLVIRSVTANPRSSALA